MGVFDFIYKLSLIGTFFLLAWYATETYKIRKITVQQKDLQLLPAMMIYIRQHSGTERPFIRNVGSGTAFEVEILDSKVAKDKLAFSFHLVDGNNTLVSQEERQIGVNVRKDGQESQSPLMNFQAYYDPANLQQIEINRDGGTIDKNTPIQRELTIRFKDITGQSYESEIRFSPKGISVIKAPERIRSGSKK